jgi:hypothetical protein
MADEADFDPEYADIQNNADLKKLNSLLGDTVHVSEWIAHSEHVPDPLRMAAFRIQLAAKETLAFTYKSTWSEVRMHQPEPPERPGVRYKRRKKGETTKGIIEFSEQLKKEPDYKNVEFSCIADFDKCRKQRGKKSALCHLAFFICMARRMIPFVRQK